MRKMTGSFRKGSQTAEGWLGSATLSSVNVDLKFTTEVAEDFKVRGPPTIDLTKEILGNSYIEKSKTSYQMMKRSAMSEQQR